MSVYDDLNLPLGVLELQQLSAIEDILLAILKPIFEPSIQVHATIPTKPATPFILVRRLSGVGDWAGDQRGFYDRARFAIHVYATNPDGDMKAAVLSDAVRKALHNAWVTHWSDPELGTVVRLKMTSEPSRTSDWATSSGPVQYADLPNGAWRYEAHYTVTIRAPQPE